MSSTDSYQMGMMGSAQLIIGAILVEHLLEGIHRNPVTSSFRDLLITKIGKGSLGGQYLLCKFCESWAAGWIIAIFIMLWYSHSWGWNWLWAGIVMSSLANVIHGVKDWLAVAKFGPLGKSTVTMKKEGN
jgi:hypothetical protein